MSGKAPNKKKLEKELKDIKEKEARLAREKV